MHQRCIADYVDYLVFHPFYYGMLVGIWSGLVFHFLFTRIAG